MVPLTSEYLPLEVGPVASAGCLGVGTGAFLSWVKLSLVPLMGRAMLNGVLR